jgi:hypothetical protein
MAILHGILGCLALGAGLGVARLKQFKVPLTTSFTEWGPGGVPKPAIQVRALIQFVPLVSIFAFLSCLFHSLVLIFYNRYLADLRKGQQRFRWVEYGLSSSFMIVFISQLFGVYDICTLTLAFVCNWAMNAFGDSFEVTNSYMRYAGLGSLGGKIDWANFIYGCITGVAPWAIIFTYIGGLGAGTDQVPGFVWAVLIVYLLFFATFPINMIMQYLAVPRKFFADNAFPGSGYYQGEKGYQILSLVAKSLLLFLVLGGGSQPNAYNELP